MVLSNLSESISKSLVAAVEKSLGTGSMISEGMSPNRGELKYRQQECKK